MSISPSIGNRVGDSNISEDNTAIIVGISNKKADKYEIDSDGTTVKDVNKQYSGDDTVVLVAFESHLERVIPNWAFLESKELTQKVMTCDVNKYAYPESRLYHINHGLINGVTVTISGIEEPMNQKSGAYTFTIDEGENTIYEESDIINYGGSTVTKTTVIYEGIISALKWITENRPDYGVLIRTENDVCINQLNNKYEVWNKGDEMLLYEINLLLNDIPYFVTSLEPQYKQEYVIEKSKNTYKNKQKPKIN